MKQVSFLFLLLSQCCSEGKIYCVCVNGGRNWSSWEWAKARNWPFRACWRYIFWYLWQIWASQWTLFGQLLHINCESCSSLDLYCQFFIINNAHLIKAFLWSTELWCHNTLWVHCLGCTEHVYIDNREGKKFNRKVMLTNRPMFLSTMSWVLFFFYLTMVN